MTSAMSDSPIQRYLHDLLRCPIENLPALVAEAIPPEVQNWLSESSARQQDFDLLMAAARQEPYTTEYGEISHVLKNFGPEEDYGWKELMGCVDAVGNTVCFVLDVPGNVIIRPIIELLERLVTPFVII